MLAAFAITHAMVMDQLEGVLKAFDHRGGSSHFRKWILIDPTVYCYSELVYMACILIMNAFTVIAGQSGASLGAKTATATMATTITRPTHLEDWPGTFIYVYSAVE